MKTIEELKAKLAAVAKLLEKWRKSKEPRCFWYADDLESTLGTPPAVEPVPPEGFRFMMPEEKKASGLSEKSNKGTLVMLCDPDSPALKRLSELFKDAPIVTEAAMEMIRQAAASVEHAPAVEADPYAELKAAWGAGRRIRSTDEKGYPSNWRTKKDGGWMWNLPPERYEIEPLHADKWAAEKAAYARGEKIEYQYLMEEGGWSDWLVTINEPRWLENGQEKYRKAAINAVMNPAPVHPEDFCEECKRPNISWHAQSELWNEAMRGPGKDEPIVCPSCFAKHLESHRGVEYLHWELKIAARSPAGKLTDEQLGEIGAKTAAKWLQSGIRGYHLSVNENSSAYANEKDGRTAFAAAVREAVEKEVRKEQQTAIDCLQQTITELRQEESTGEDWAGMYQEKCKECATLRAENATLAKQLAAVRLIVSKETTA